MNILLITEDFPPDFIGGISSWAWDLAWTLHNSGETLEVMARKTAGAKEHDQQQALNINRVPGRSWARWKSLWMYLKAKNRRPHVAIFSNWELAQLLAKKLKNHEIKIAVAAHGSDIRGEKVNFKKLHQTAQHVDLWMPVSESLKKSLLRKLPDANAHVIPMPVSISQKARAYSKERPLAVLARLTPWKGIEAAIEICDAIDRELWIIGDGPERKYLEEKAKGKSVIFFGKKSRQTSLELLQKSGACMLLSESSDGERNAEGLGLCLLEAAAAGVPVIGSRCGGIPEAVGEGLVIDPKAPDLKKIRQFIDDPESGIRCWKWVKEHHGQKKTLAFLRQRLMDSS